MIEPVQPIQMGQPVQPLSLGWDNNSCDVAAQIAVMSHRRNVAAHWATASSMTFGIPQVTHASASPVDLPSPDPDSDVDKLTIKVVRSLTNADLEVLKVLDTKTAPPALADKLGYFLLSPEWQDEVLGDLKERFNQRWLPELGPFGARCCYLWHVVTVSAALKRAAIIGVVVGFLIKKFGG